MIYFCILKTKDQKITDFYFDKEIDYYTFLFANRKDVEWAKLINNYSGEIIDSYTSFSNLHPDILNITLPKNAFKDSEFAMLINKQKMFWFMSFINKHSVKTSQYLRENQFEYLTVSPRTTQKDGCYIPENMIIVSSRELENIYIMLEKELSNSSYKKRLLKIFVDLDGFEIRTNNYYLK